MADTQAGGWSARWPAASAETAIVRIGRGAGVDGRIRGAPVRIALDSGADGPLRVRASVAQGLGLSPRLDVLGRRLASAGPLEVGTLSFPALWVQVSDEIPEGADAMAGGVFFRETVVEMDPGEARVRFHDPARWTPPAGYFRDSSTTMEIARSRSCVRAPARCGFAPAPARPRACFSPPNPRAEWSFPPPARWPESCAGGRRPFLQRPSPSNRRPSIPSGATTAASASTSFSISTSSGICPAAGRICGRSTRPQVLSDRCQGRALAVILRSERRRICPGRLSRSFAALRMTGRRRGHSHVAPGQVARGIVMSQPAQRTSGRSARTPASRHRTAAQ